MAIVVVVVGRYGLVDCSLTRSLDDGCWMEVAIATKASRVLMVYLYLASIRPAPYHSVYSLSFFVSILSALVFRNHMPDFYIEGMVAKIQLFLLLF